MKRLIDFHLRKWKNSAIRRPLLLRGARQVGKTYAVRAFSTSFSSFVEINFEVNKKVRALFEGDIDPNKILQVFSAMTEKRIVPGETLLFLDEIQTVPEAITALRYFYEKFPELHIIAAGSLLDFAIEKVGVPVGRVQFLYMYPLSFIEFLRALEKPILIEQILTHPIKKEPEVLHETLLQHLGSYIAIGGMPQSVECWRSSQNLLDCAQISQILADAYRYDFIKYGKSHQIKYLELLFSHIPHQLGKKFKYNLVGEYRKRELEPCLELLTTAGIIHKVQHSDAQGIPLGAQVNPDMFKLLFIDVALSQFMLDIKTGDWILNPLESFINKGTLAEAFVGQELLAYEHPTKKANLYYWHRNSKGSEAELDFVIQHQDKIFPIEVKSSQGTRLRSLHMFLETHENSPYGIRFSTHPYSIYEKVHSYPLYAIANIAANANEDIKKSFEDLCN